MTRLDFPIHASGALSGEVLGLGWSRFDQLAGYVKSLPYGRTSVADPLGVLREKRGTCSAKHQLLAALAHECGHPEVQLTVGLYLMSEENTPGVGALLAAASLPSIPEAHCYLVVDGERFDFTGLAPGSRSPFDALLSEHVVTPADLPQRKVELHRQALATWADAVGVSANAAWALREACIAALSHPQPEAPVTIEPYDIEWPARFAAERELIARVLAPWLAGPIEHIGSTAVAGLAAKPVIDIMAAVGSLEASRPALKSLEAIGYCYFPYRAEVMHWFCKPSAQLRTHHLHLVPLGSRMWRERLAFRDRLRADAGLAAEYGELKQRLARAHRNDREAYTDAKAPFVERVLRDLSGHQA